MDCSIPPSEMGEIGNIFKKENRRTDLETCVVSIRSTIFTTRIAFGDILDHAITTALAVEKKRDPIIGSLVRSIMVENTLVDLGLIIS